VKLYSVQTIYMHHHHHYHLHQCLQCYDNISVGNCVHFHITMSIKCMELLMEMFKSDSVNYVCD